MIRPEYWKNKVIIPIREVFNKACKSLHFTHDALLAWQFVNSAPNWGRSATFSKKNILLENLKNYDQSLTSKKRNIKSWRDRIKHSKQVCSFTRVFNNLTLLLESQTFMKYSYKVLDCLHINLGGRFFLPSTAKMLALPTTFTQTGHPVITGHWTSRV